MNDRRIVSHTRKPLHATNISIRNGSYVRLTERTTCEFCTTKRHNSTIFAFIFRRLNLCYHDMSERTSATAVLGFVERAQMGRAKRGIYAGKEVLFGNNVSFSNRKTRRRWNPNVQKKIVTSDILGETFKLNVRTHALRSIRKYGGLDNYLTNQPQRKLEDSNVAIILRQRILAKQRAIKVEDK